MRPLLPLLLLLGAAAASAPAAAAPIQAEEIGAAFEAIVDLPGDVSLAAALVDEDEPRYFLTQESERALALGSPADAVRRLASVRKSGHERALAVLAAGSWPYGATSGRYDFFGAEETFQPGAAALSFLLKNRSGRWIAVSVVWEGASATPDALRPSVERLLGHFAEG
jgi:hypothetical protein